MSYHPNPTGEKRKKKKEKRKKKKEKRKKKRCPLLQCL
jgi:hypothetical protein